MANNHIEFSIRLSDGSFDTRITLPTSASEESVKAFIAEWMALQKVALQVMASQKEAEQL